MRSVRAAACLFTFVLLFVHAHGATGAPKTGWNLRSQILHRIIPPAFPVKDFPVTTYGATADGVADCTEAFAHAIDACSAAGGGRVVVPAGTYSTGAIHLKSNVNLHLAKGATILFSTDPKKYLPVVFTRWEGTECMNYSALIYAYGQTNIAVTGEGVLDGQGSNETWWNWCGKAIFGWKQGGPSQKEGKTKLFDYVKRGVPVEARVIGEGGYLRPNFVQPVKCTNVLIEGVTLKNSPMWFIHPVLSKNVTVKNVNVTGAGPNNDGCDPECSSDVLITGTTFNTGDDCIAIKSGRNDDGRRVNVPTTNVIVTGCKMLDGHGGVVIGSEVSGGISNIFVDNCEMDSPQLDRALRFKTNSVRGGIIENFYARNIRVGQVREAAILVDFQYEEGDAGQFTPVLRNLFIDSLTCSKGEYAVLIHAYDRSPVTNLSITNCTFTNIAKENVFDKVVNVTVKNVTLNGAPMTYTPAVAPVPASKASHQKWSVLLADNFLRLHPDSITYSKEGKPGKWNYEQGLMLEAFHRMWLQTRDEKYFSYIKKASDQYVRADGSIATYKSTEFQLDHIAPGRPLFYLLERTKEQKYRTAIDTLRRQLAAQPRTSDGGFWHKTMYPHQMWLDGLYMAEPFYAQYATAFKEPQDFDDIAKQFLLAAAHMRDSATGLFYHGWDESKTQPWAHPKTGCSPHFWGRAMGWYMMGLVDALDYIPASHPKRKELIAVFTQLARDLERYRDSKTGLWYQVVDKPAGKGNYLEASVSSMVTYAYAKGARRGFLDKRYAALARESFQGILTTLVTTDADGTINLNHVCSVAGLGGTPYRDGSYEYYVGEPQRTNDFKGYGPFLLAAIELEHSSNK